MPNNYQWVRYRQLRSHVTHITAPGAEAVTITGPNSPPTSALRALFFPHVASSWDPASANPPAPGWWESAQLTMSFTWVPDGSALVGQTELGEADPPAVSLGFVKLYPHLYVRGVATAQYTCVWTPDTNTVEFEAGRRTDVPPNPSIVAAVWCLDSFGVFSNPVGFINVTHSVVNYGSILWNNPT